LYRTKKPPVFTGASFNPKNLRRPAKEKPRRQKPGHRGQFRRTPQDRHSCPPDILNNCRKRLFFTRRFESYIVKETYSATVKKAPITRLPFFLGQTCCPCFFADSADRPARRSCGKRNGFYPPCLRNTAFALKLRNIPTKADAANKT
jgi:hypothetical protein